MVETRARFRKGVLVALVRESEWRLDFLDAISTSRSGGRPIESSEEIICVTKASSLHPCSPMQLPAISFDIEFD